RTGIIVNGKRVQWSPLGDKDELQVGKFLIRFHCHAPISSGTPPGASPVASELRPLTADADTIPSAENNVAPDSTASRQLVSHSPVQPDAEHGQLDVPADVVEATNEYLSSLAPMPGMEQAEVWRSIIGPLFQQFSVMHQNMFDQF